MATEALYAVIPAGGSGTRLWPLSRASNPKFLHALTGGPSTLLQATVERLARSPAETTFVVTGVAHAAAVHGSCRGCLSRTSWSSRPRAICAAIGLAASVIVRRDPDAVMASFAADHLVRDARAFSRSRPRSAEPSRTCS
jgi:mannose-1-phosphate guanylyltransferase